MNKKAQQELTAYLEGFVSQKRRNLLKSILEQRSRYLSIMLEDLYQPHNTAAVLRSCDAFGVQDVHVLQISNRYQPSKMVSVGAEKWVYQHRHAGDEGLTLKKMKEFKEQGWALVATCPNEDGYTPSNLPLDKPLMLMFGSEKPGLSEQAIEEADYRLQIPMHGFSESFNVSVSVALILQVLSSRIREENIEWGLNAEEKELIYLDWLRNSIKRSSEVEKHFLEQLS